MRRWIAPIALALITLVALTYGIATVHQILHLIESRAHLDASYLEDAMARSRRVLLLSLLLCTLGVGLGLLHLTRSRRRERRFAASAVRRQEREVYFRTLLQNAADVILLTDPQGTIRDISPAVERVLGVPAETVRHTCCFDYALPSDRSRLKLLLANCLTTPGGTILAETRVIHADGNWRHVEVITTNLLADPVMGGLLMTVRDITERRRTETALAEQEQLYALVTENSSDIIALYNVHGETLSVSPASMTILGYAPDEYAALDLRAAVHPAELQRVRDARIRS